MMKLLNLNDLPGQQSMLIFHALARIGFEGLVLVSPRTPLVSIGYFQDAEKEIDIDYCKKAGIPITRREVGGGATFLDKNQIFYQLIWRKGNPCFSFFLNRLNLILVFHKGLKIYFLIYQSLFVIHIGILV